MSRVAAVLVVGGLLAAGCGGSSGSSSVAASQSPPAAASSAPGGLVGVIDRARVLSVCANVQQASTALDAQLGEDVAARAVLAAAQLLERPPRVSAAVSLAGTLRDDVHRGDTAAAVQAGQAFCRANGG